ncbi:hypothetical protein Cni_G11670 [Canna indica]|uniref:Ubiquitin-conjugating enzyme E2C-binding protein n=1 Tax=Canna indica TaxID=4628 RepID=A0AAQ3KC70_9LILI|nr:hypothetical protein Cni_G11670 [Canna indica]
MMVSSPQENPSRRQWRFTWETLPHIPTLRLYLFHPDVDPSDRLRNLSASLRLQQSLVVVSWLHETGDLVLLRIPIPKVLIDPSCPVDCRAMNDHVEIKLALVLPVDHPAVADLCGVLDSDRGAMAGGDGQLLNPLLPLSLDSDINSLSAGGVHFFCKSCSTKLTKQPLRHFVEMPSANWREVADNWFGSCCCSFGSVTEKIACQYVNKYDCPAGTCLVDGASVIICQDDLEGYTFQDPLVGYSEHHKDKVVSYVIRTNSAEGSNDLDLVEDNIDIGGTSACSLSEMDNMFTDLAREPSSEKGPDLLSQIFPSAILHNNASIRVESGLKGASNVVQASLDLCSKDANLMELKLDNCCENSQKLLQELPNGFSFSCHSHNCNDNVDEIQETTGLPFQGKQKWLHNSSLGGGFIVNASNFSQDIKWVEFLCKNCSSLIGCYPSSKSANIPVDGGIRLFKCFISTSTPVGGPCDIFRNHTLQRVFVNLLLESAEDELSYRIIVRDLKSKFPMLLLVFLSSKSWSSSGCCLENGSTEPLSADLRPVLKVLFTDCSIGSEANSRTVDDWSIKNHTEEVYMMTHLIEQLAMYLKSSLHELPPSCSSLQGMSLSSLER